MLVAARMAMYPPTAAPGAVRTPGAPFATPPSLAAPGLRVSTGRSPATPLGRLSSRLRPTRPGLRPVPRSGAPAPAGPDGLREQAGLELRRLNAEALRPELERRELLADLGTRLAALARHPGTAPGDALAAVRRLAELLAGDGALLASASEFAQLWSRVLAVLAAVADGRPVPEQSSTGAAGDDAHRTEGTRARGPFWRKG